MESQASNTIEKGTKTRLNVTPESNHRVMVGLSWDPSSDDELSIVDRMNDFVAGKQSNHDLDLLCYVFDRDHNLLDTVSGHPGQTRDQSQKIYHSGDNMDGTGAGDDEEISAELLDLDDQIYAMVFVAQISSGQTFEEIIFPAIRLVDAYSSRTLVKTDIAAHEDNKGHDAYVFCTLYRHEGEDNGSWDMQYVDTFAAFNETTWIDDLMRYL